MNIIYIKSFNFLLNFKSYLEVLGAYMCIQTAFKNEWKKKEPNDIAKGFYFQIENAFTFDDNQLENLYKMLQTKHKNLFSDIIGSNGTYK